MSLRQCFGFAMAIVLGTPERHHGATRTTQTTSSMRYVDRMLHPGETIVYRTTLHPLILVKPALAFVLMLALAGSLPGMLPDFYDTLSSALLLVMFVPYSALVVASFMFGDIAVTNQRVLLRSGVLRGQFRQVLLHKIEQAKVNGRMPGGCGGLSIHIAGGVVQSISFVRDPDALQQAIEHASAELVAAQT